MLLLAHCWRGAVSVRTVVITAIGFHAVAVALPLLLSHDVFSYIMYGRIAGIYHANPYLVPPSHFPHDPIYASVSSEWRGVTSLYGPGFTHVSVLIGKVVHGTGNLILAYKLLAAAASLGTMVVTIRVAQHVRPERAAFAGALIGVNPLVTIDVVAGGHMDALVALAVALALLALCAGGTRLREIPLSRQVVVAVLLTLGAMVKPPFAICVVVFVAAMAFRSSRSLAKSLTLTIGAVAGVVVLCGASFFELGHPTLGLLSVTRYQNWVASPVLFSVVLPFFLGIRGSSFIGLGLWTTVVKLIFLTIEATALLWVVRLAHRHALEPAPVVVGATLGWGLLLLLLTAPIVWAWYVVWLLPLVWLLPRTPRLAALAMSAVLTGWTVVGDWNTYGALYRALALVGLLVVSPFFLYLLAKVGRDLVAQVRGDQTIGAGVLDTWRPAPPAIRTPGVRPSGQPGTARKMTPSSSR